MSNFELNYDDVAASVVPEVPSARLDATEGTWTLNRDEAATIWYSLHEYKSSLEAKLHDLQSDHAAEGGSGYYEELMFLHDHLHKVTKLMFELRDDHEAEQVADADGHIPPHKQRTANAVRQWLDVS